ncbi:helix-turn-helix domain-containing protein, partial [Dolichospermum sp. UHCC 0259]|nr:helix-turn-helix domain-containing protein [Dolichospermum sp. UHCC 0259]
MASTEERFVQATNYWDLETLYTDIASAKGKRLTPVEKLHLRGLLCGYSPAEIAERLNKSNCSHSPTKKELGSNRD